MRRWLLPLVLLASACSARLGEPAGADGGRAAADAGEAPDAPAPVAVDAAVAPPDAPACAGGRVVYLAFEGVALTRAAQSDAALGHASWMTVASANVPRYHAGSATRDADIATIVDGVRAQLAGIPVTVVTTRPAAGPYVMVALGGVASQVGSRYTGAVQALDCGDLVASDVAWVSDKVAPLPHVINDVVGAIGFGLGLTGTTEPGDCLCGWANGCASIDTAACTLSPMIARDPNASQRCPGLTQQDEPAAFRAAFCP